MARKKRRLEPVTVAATETKEKVRYEDEFQQKVGSKVEEFGKKFEGQGRNILYALGALVVIGIIAWFIYAWSSRSEAAGQAAFRGLGGRTSAVEREIREAAARAAAMQAQKAGAR